MTRQRTTASDAAHGPRQGAAEDAMIVRPAADPFDDFMVDPADIEEANPLDPHALPNDGTVFDKPQPREENLLRGTAPPQPRPSPRRSLKFPLVSLLLLAAISAGAWRLHVLGAERDGLVRELRLEANAQRQAQQAARNAEIDLSAARGELAAARNASQHQPSGPLKAAERACTTPPSILRGRGL